MKRESLSTRCFMLSKRVVNGVICRKIFQSGTRPIIFTTAPNLKVCGINPAKQAFENYSSIKKFCAAKVIVNLLKKKSSRSSVLALIFQRKSNQNLRSYQNAGLWSGHSLGWGTRIDCLKILKSVLPPLKLWCESRISTLFLRWF